MSEPGWHPDPYGRYEYRFWDGQQWTDQASTGGVTYRDADVQQAPPTPDQASPAQATPEPAVPGPTPPEPPAAADVPDAAPADPAPEPSQPSTAPDATTVIPPPGAESPEPTPEPPAAPAPAAPAAPSPQPPAAPEAPAAPEPAAAPPPPEPSAPEPPATPEPPAAATPPPPPAAAASPPPPPAPSAPASTPPPPTPAAQVPPAQPGAPPPPAPLGGPAGEKKRNWVPIAIAGGVAAVVLIGLIVLLGGGGGGGDGTGEEDFALGGREGVFVRDVSFDAGFAYRVRVDAEGDWSPRVAVTVDPSDFAGSIRENGEFLSDLSLLSDADLDAPDSELLDSVGFFTDLDSLVTDSAQAPDDLGSRLVLNQSPEFGESFATAADLALFDVDLKIVVFNQEASEDEEEFAGRILVEKTDEALDGNQVGDIFLSDDIPGDVEDFLLSDEAFFSNS